MKHSCTYCTREPIVNIPFKKLRLCEQHFIQYFETEFENIVEQYQMLKGVRRLLVAVSGGKDSVVMLHLLAKIAKRKKIELIGLTIDLGIEGYSQKCVEIAKKHFEALGVDYKIVKLEEYGFTIDKAKKYEHALKRPICSVCGLAKRYIMNKMALELKCDAIATGHNLVDVAQYLIANYMSGNLEALLKLKPVTESEEGVLVARIRPLYFFHEHYIELYARLTGLEHVSERCPYSERGRVSRDMPFQEYLRIMLLELDRRYPGTLYSFVQNFVRQVLPALQKSMTTSERLRKCRECGMPTSSRDEICSFCKIRSALIKLESAQAVS